MPTRKYDSEETYTFSLRVSKSLRESIMSEAERTRRSYNQTVIALLEYAFEKLREERNSIIE